MQLPALSLLENDGVQTQFGNAFVTRQGTERPLSRITRLPLLFLEQCGGGLDQLVKWFEDKTVVRACGVGIDGPSLQWYQSALLTATPVHPSAALGNLAHHRLDLVSHLRTPSIYPWTNLLAYLGWAEGTTSGVPNGWSVNGSHNAAGSSFSGTLFSNTTYSFVTTGAADLYVDIAFPVQFKSLTLAMTLALTTTTAKIHIETIRFSDIGAIPGAAVIIDSVSSSTISTDGRHTVTLNRTSDDFFAVRVRIEATGAGTVAIAAPSLGVRDDYCTSPDARVVDVSALLLWDTLVLHGDDQAAVTNNLIFLDRDGTFQSRLTLTGDNELGIRHGFATDVANQLLFWTHAVGDDGVYKGNFANPVSQIEIVGALSNASDFRGPNQIVYDQSRQKLVWNNQFDDEIQECDTDGSNFATLKSLSNGGESCCIALGRIFYDIASEIIFSRSYPSLDNSKVEKVMDSEVKQIHYSPTAERFVVITADHKVRSYNSSWADEQTLRNCNATARCFVDDKDPSGVFVYITDRQTGVFKAPIDASAATTQLSTDTIDGIDWNLQGIAALGEANPIGGITETTGETIDKVFYVDSTNHAVRSVDEDGGNDAEVRDLGSGLALRGITNDGTNLYVVNFQSGTSGKIIKLPITGASQSDLITSLDNPYDVAWYNNKIYYTRGTSIRSANDDGTSDTEVATISNSGRGIAVDPINEKIVYSMVNDELRVMDLDGSNDTLLTTASEESPGLAAYAGSVFATEFGTNDYYIIGIDGNGETTVVTNLMGNFLSYVHQTGQVIYNNDAHAIRYVGADGEDDTQILSVGGGGGTVTGITHTTA